MFLFANPKLIIIMKAKLLLTVGVLFVFVTLFYSCGKDETVPPGPASLTFDPDTTDTFTGFPGDTWSFKVMASAPSGFDSLYVEKTVGTGSPVIIKSITTATGDSTVYSFSYTLVEEEVGENVQFTFTLVEEGTSGASAVKNVVTNSPPADAFSAILLYAPLGNKTANSFFSTNTGATYSPDSVVSSADPLSADIDFGYYYGQTNMASLASPKGFTSTVFASQVAGWNKLNQVTFKTTDVTQSQFTEMSTVKDIRDAFDAGTDITDPNDPNIVTNLTAGQVIAFATDEGKSGGSKKGLIMVSEIKGTFNQNDYIKLDILVEPQE